MRSNSSGDSLRTTRTSSSGPAGRRRDLIVTQNFINHDDIGGAPDPNTTETYMGEWKNDLRSGFGT